VLLRPRSRGTVRLRSADPTEPPLIHLPNLRDPTDVERLVEGYLRGLAVACRPEIRRRCAAPPSPDTDHREDLPSLIGANAYSFTHVVGTCSMGPHPDDAAVVDASGRVHGAERLSVVDASIVPNGPSGFTHMPTVMLADLLGAML